MALCHSTPIRVFFAFMTAGCSVFDSDTPPNLDGYPGVAEPTASGTTTLGGAEHAEGWSDGGSADVDSSDSATSSMSTSSTGGMLTGGAEPLAGYRSCKDAFLCLQVDLPAEELQHDLFETYCEMWGLGAFEQGDCPFEGESIAGVCSSFQREVLLLGRHESGLVYSSRACDNDSPHGPPESHCASVEGSYFPHEFPCDSPPQLNCGDECPDGGCPEGTECLYDHSAMLDRCMPYDCATCEMGCSFDLVGCEFFQCL